MKRNSIIKQRFIYWLNSAITTITKLRFCAIWVSCACLLLITACIQENQGLVNPPLIVETVNVRFMNLSKDETPRTLQFDSKIMGQDVAYNTISQSSNPPYDSVTIQIFQKDKKTYNTTQKFKFGRLSNYIMLAVPNYNRQNPADSNEFKNEDTLIYLQTTILKPNDTNMCYIKFLNANTDSSYNYSIKMGCPNGDNLFIDNNITNVRYMQSTGTQQVFEGKRVVSIIKNSNYSTDPENPAQSEVIGIFELNLVHLRQYALIVNKSDEVYFIDELDANSPPQLLTSVPQRTANVRVINLSSENISVTSIASGDFTTNLSPNYIGEYSSVSTCEIMNLDKILLTSGSQINDSIYMSFDIFKNYSIIAFDTKEKKAAKLIAIPPANDRFLNKPDAAIVRIVNGNIENNAITVSVGARNAQNDLGYSSGQTLASNLQAGEYSTEIYLSGSSCLPISVFAATQPTKYLFSGIINIENGKEYIITINNAQSNMPGTIVAVELNEQNMTAKPAINASLVQLINTTTEKIKFSLNNTTNDFNIIQNGTMTPNTMITTFLPLGDNSVSTLNNNYTFINNNLENRTLVIINGTSTYSDIFSFQGVAMQANNTNFKWRFINAASDIPSLDVYKIDKNAVMQNSSISYKNSSDINEFIKDQKFSFVFKPTGSSETLYTANDLLMTLNKNYSIIFWGNKNTNYGITLLQEY